MIFDPEDIAKWTGGAWHRLPLEAVRGFAIDSRKISKGDCFVALRTDKRDGHLFLSDAAKNGAVAAIVEDVVDHELPQLVVAASEKGLQDCAAGYRNELTIPVIGISGSCGKTSTKDLLSRLLGEDITLWTEANLNNTLGVPLTILRIDEAVHRFAVIEAGISRRGKMDTIVSILKPTHGIITMLGTAHSEGLGGVEGIAEEKCKLLEATASDGVVVFPADCKDFEVFNQLNTASVLQIDRCDGNDDLALQHRFRVEGKWPSLETEEDFCARDTEIETRDINIETDRDRDRVKKTRETDRDRMQKCGREQRTIIVELPAVPSFKSELPPMSDGMASNAALAIVVARILGISAEKLSARLSTWRPSPGRGEVVKYEDQVYYVDCYNANPSSMKDTIEFFQSQWSGLPKLYVLGTMNELGDLFDAGHHEIGSILSLSADDQAIFIGHGAEAFKRGALENSISSERLNSYDQADDASGLVNSFKGAILLKGSRSYALESLLPENSPSMGGEAVAC